MQNKRLRKSILFGLVLVLGSQAASAIGWSRAQRTAVLGQPLDFTAALRLDPGDVVAPECVRAEVWLGEQRVPPALVRVAVDAGSPDALVMRVSSGPVVDEPIVTVTLSVGCPAHMSRRFVLLADPPALAAAPIVAQSPSAAPESGPAAEPATAPSPASGPVPAPVRAVLRPPPEPAARPAPDARREPAPPRHVAAKRPRKATVAAAAPQPVARLRLDPAEMLPAAPSPVASAVEDALAAVAQAASAARAAASAASAAEARIVLLERTVDELRIEARTNRDIAAQLRERLAQADGGRWTWPLLAALALMAVVTAWSSWRLRAMQRERLAMWRRAAAAEAAARPATPTSQLPMVTSEIPLPPAPATMPFRPAPAAPAPVPPPSPRTVSMPRPVAPAPPVERTDVLPPHALPDHAAPRDVTIEELLDLEQQAEFFVVLGQEDAAIDLLVGHLRDTGGGSPLPYLKLLEIYRRRNEREAYERIRNRFNQRFNAYAPDWDSDLLHGRSLEDYPGVVPRLAQVWPRPLDAMAELEALLFRKSRGDLFDLPAYREVLFLYSLARDLLDREAADSGNVDLLLPLADGSEFSATSPHPYFGRDRDSVFDGLRDERPTAPVDLDITQPDAGPVIEAPASRRP